MLLNIACARLYGTKTDALLSEIDRICGKGKKNSCGDEEDSVVRETMKKWARIEPPFRLDLAAKESRDAPGAK